MVNEPQLDPAAASPYNEPEDQLGRKVGGGNFMVRVAEEFLKPGSSLNGYLVRSRLNEEDSAVKIRAFFECLEYDDDETAAMILSMIAAAKGSDGQAIREALESLHGAYMAQGRGNRSAVGRFLNRRRRGNTGEMPEGEGV